MRLSFKPLPLLRNFIMIKKILIIFLSTGISSLSCACIEPSSVKVMIHYHNESMLDLIRHFIQDQFAHENIELILSRLPNDNACDTEEAPIAPNAAIHIVIDNQSSEKYNKHFPSIPRSLADHNTALIAAIPIADPTKCIRKFASVITESTERTDLKPFINSAFTIAYFNDAFHLGHYGINSFESWLRTKVADIRGYSPDEQPESQAPSYHQMQLLAFNGTPAELSQLSKQELIEIIIKLRLSLCR